MTIVVGPKTFTITERGVFPLWKKLASEQKCLGSVPPVFVDIEFATPAWVKVVETSIYDAGEPVVYSGMVTLPIPSEEFVSEPGCPEETTPAPPAKPFHEAVIETYKGIKDWFNKPDSLPADSQVREQVNADIDDLIDRRSSAKPWPGIL